MSRIEVSELTKDYGGGKGIFNIDFSVEKGEIYGFLGSNGAGKTTVIRHLMGFIKPQSGTARIDGKDCFREREAIQKNLGYLPGEVALMDEMTGIQFLNFMAKMKGMKSHKRMKELLDYLEFDPKGKIRKMSKGMKQKLGIICGFMDNPQILLLDEPTSGLDPLMQNRFIDLVLEEKKKGVTILLSSHIFEEVERTCDKISFVREGKIVATKNMDEVRRNKKRTFAVYFAEEADRQDFMAKHPEAVAGRHHVEVPIVGEADKMIKELALYKISDIHIKTPSLEDMFLQYYKEVK